ncbi:hypothetical protein AAY473_029139 [Plecturocebus cupreus]
MTLLIFMAVDQHTTICKPLHCRTIMNCRTRTGSVLLSGAVALLIFYTIILVTVQHRSSDGLSICSYHCSHSIFMNHVSTFTLGHLVAFHYTFIEPHYLHSEMKETLYPYIN